MPTLDVVLDVARYLAGRADRNPEEELSRFHELWISAAHEDAVVGGGESQPLKLTLDSDPSKVREPHRAGGSAMLPPQRTSPQAESGVAVISAEPGSTAWLEIIELTLSAVLLSLFPVKSRAYTFLSKAGIPSENYVVGDPSKIDYWVDIVEYVSSESSVKSLEDLIKLAAETSEGGEQKLHTLLGALSENPRS
ncbi:hypothetical protein [Streptomyces bluensis]|uniref:Uncharacterized protein n=1 Tax=Streptomyces bluensis TaxID=33897 RepID=A0ABW6ULC5_9ACTN